MASKSSTLCILGCGNLGTAILSSLLSSTDGDNKLPFESIVACVRSGKSKEALEKRFPSISVRTDDVVGAVREAGTVILGVDVADVEHVLQLQGLREALQDKLMISVVAGRTRSALETTMYGTSTTAQNQQGRVRLLRVLPNIAAVVSQSLTAVEVATPSLPEEDLQLADAIFQRIGRTVRVPPSRMNAATAVGGSTPAIFAVICDALIDAALAVGVPRDEAQVMIYQAMQGTATMLQSGVHPGVLKDQGTSPEGCTIGGLMVMEEAGVRGHLGRALREAVTIARLMESVEHVNDTRH